MAAPALEGFRKDDAVRLNVLKATTFYKDLGMDTRMDILPGEFLGHIVESDNVLVVCITLRNGSGYKNLADILQGCRPELQGYTLSKR